MSAAAAVERLAPIGLDELRDDAPLLERVERKYIATVAEAVELLSRLEATHRALEIDGLREFRYRTTYYDTADLVSLRDHLQLRRRRFKCRRRVYLDSGFAALEVKFKGLRGATLKAVRPAGAELPLHDAELRFLSESVQQASGRMLDLESLAPTLTVDVRRLTVAAPALHERVTCDTAVGLGEWRLADGLVIVETKSRAGRASADRILLSMGVRPQVCSKYCVGMALAHSRLRANAYLPVMRRFVAVSPG
jgi:hypothetical protein